MKVKKEYFLLAAVILGLSAYLFMRNTNNVQYKLPVLNKIHTKDITKIMIQGPDGKTLIHKKDGNWLISPKEYPADKSKVESMLKTLKGMTLTALVSEAKSYERYDLGPKKKITVAVWAGDSLKRRIDVGKAASTYRHTFVKLDGDFRVFQVEDNFKNKFSQSIDDLRDKNVMSFDEKEIRQVDIQKGKEKISLALSQVPVEVEVKGKKEEKKKSAERETEPAWKSADGTPVVEASLRSVFSTMSNLDCRKFIEGKKKEDLKDPIFTVTLKGNKDYRLDIFAKEKDEGYPAISSENDYAFYLPKWQAEKIVDSPGKILKKKEAKAKTAKAGK